ncbi:Regucalcin [Auxenochlorella protothecoides]|uniref:Regucalcin n=1 Tax=Auxenochlorella protothecoides TaxID=3075 RepID=A0A087SQD9_AUXPR|nr:Regucalcin [Auxenochlorella protothecoides]KFM27943.1 Regucalcin [Auxenochlorella protothecoides]
MANRVMGWQSRIEEFRHIYHDCISIGCSMATSQDEVTVDLALEARCDLGESPVWDGKTNTLYFVDEVTVDLALEARCDLGESPVWDGKTNNLYFVDINSRTIHGFQPETGEHFTIKADEPTGTIVPTNDPTKILVATQRDILVVDVPGRKVTKQAIATTPKEHGTEGFRFNDGKVSPSGTLLIGRMSNKWRKGARGRQYRLDPGSSTLVEVMSPEEVHLPNGIAWDGAKGVVYFIDSSTEEVRAYAADEQGIMRRGEDGALSWRTVTHRPSGLATVPDGMTIDTDGNLWVAHGESGEVTCYHPESGAVLHKVPLPVQRPTACTFGGRDLGDLYVTTRVETGEGAHKHHGGLYRIRIPGVQGGGARGSYGQAVAVSTASLRPRQTSLLPRMTG